MAMNYFHAFWTRPQLKPGVDPAAQDLVLWDFEMLFWLASALEARRHGSLQLVTDGRGALAASRTGMDSVYSGGISTALDSVPADVDPSLFWACGKLYAFRQVAAPCVCLDMDAVLWRPLRPLAPIMALHPESRNWPWYLADRELFEACGFDGGKWDWELDPVNTGVLYFGDAKAARAYAETATAFAERYSRKVRAEPALRERSDNAMIFAEQRLLPMCARRSGLPVVPLLDQPPNSTGLVHNADCTHLWLAKLAYKICDEARATLVDWLRSWLMERHPEARPLLARWGLDQPKSQPKARPVSVADLPPIQASGLRFSLLRKVRGSISVQDPISGLARQASDGSMVWCGEIIRPEPGATFELEILGPGPLNQSATAANCGENGV